MTDLEKLEAAIRRVLAHLAVQMHSPGVEEALTLIADELAKTIKKTESEK